MSEVFSKNIEERPVVVETSDTRHTGPIQDIQTAINAKVEPSISKEVKGMSFLSSLLGVKDDDRTMAVDAFIQELISSRGLKDNSDSYSEVLNDIFNELYISNNETEESKLEKLFSFIRLLQKADVLKKKDNPLKILDSYVNSL